MHTKQRRSFKLLAFFVLGLGFSFAHAQDLNVNGNIFLPSDVGNKQIYTWNAADQNWRIGMSASPGFTTSMATSHVQYITYNGGSDQGLAFGVNGGNSSFEITGGNHNAFFRGSVGIGTTDVLSQTKLRVFESGSSTGTWRGRIVSSGENSAVVMGEYNGKAVIGAHNTALNAWSDLHLQFDAGLVGIGTLAPSQKLTVNGNVLVNTENAAIGIDAQANARLGFIKKSGYGPMIAADNSHPIIFAQTNQDGLYTNIAGATLTERMRIAGNGNVGIGTTSPDQLLTVNGTIHSKEVKVDLSVPAPDYVFEKEYKLPSLEEIKTYIDQNKHLPEVPSAKEMEANGVQLGEMNMLLLKKMEEMTLYMIELKKHVEDQQKEIDQLKKNR